MKNLLLLTLLIFVNSYGQKKTEETLYIVELSIKKDAGKINEIIWDLNKNKIKGIENSEELLKMYDLAIETNKICSKMVGELEEIDSKINLKKEALAYLKLSNKFLKEGIRPILTMTLSELQENNEVLISMFNQLKKFMASTKRMSDNIVAFCNEHKLDMEISKFNKSRFDKKANKVQKLLNE